MTFLELTKLRYSAREYDAQRMVEEEKMSYIIECARLAPSACNLQPWKFYIIKNKEKKEAVCACYGNSWINSAPVLIVACAEHDVSWKRKTDGKDHADIDVAIAVEHICLAAAEQGLGTCWVCNFDAERCAKVLDLKDSERPVAIIPIGYEKQPSDAKEKKRKDVADIVAEI